MLRSKADAQATERQAAMPSPVTAARRGIVVGRYMGLSEQQAALMVMTAASAAKASALADHATDVSWLEAIHGEASRIYLRCVQWALPDGPPFDADNHLRPVTCPECGRLFTEPSPECPKRIYDLHPLAARP